MHSILRPPRVLVAMAVLATVILVMPAAAAAQSFSRLQVLLPGEDAAPGTMTGKSGTPVAQTVGEPFTVTVRACDDQWQTVAGISHLVSLSSSEETATLPADFALVGGEATATVVFNAAGAFSVSASDLTDGTIPDGISSEVVSMYLQGFLFSAINQKNQYAGQPMTITVQAVDGAGEVVTGYSGPVSLQEITSYGPGRIEPDEVQLTNGSWTGPLTMYRADETSINRGNVNIYAFLQSQPDKNGTSDPFTVHPGTLDRLQIVAPGEGALPGSVSGLTGQPASQAAGTDFDVEIAATDNWWNPVPSAHAVRVVSSDPAAGTPVEGALVEGRGRLTLSLGTVGTQTLTVTDLTDGSVRSMTTAPIPVIPAAVHHFVVEPLPASVVAGEPVGVTIRATDSMDNTLPDYDGDAFLSANTGAGSLLPESISFSGGVWTGELVFRGAGGAVSFSCSDYSSPPHSGTSEAIEVLPGEFAGLQVLLPGETPQGGTLAGKIGAPEAQNAGAPFMARIRAVDRFFNRIPGFSDRIAVTSSDPFALAPADTGLIDGELLVPVTIFRGGDHTVTAADLDSTETPVAVSAEVAVASGPYSRLLLLAPGEELAPGTETGRTGEATDQSITFAFTLVVYATDEWGNPVGGVTDLVGLTCSDPMAQLPDDTPMVDGRADLVVRLATGGYQQLTATNLTQPIIPGSTTQVRAISSGLHLEASIVPDVVQAGDPFTLEVQVTNDAGSVIQEINSYVDVEIRQASTQDPGTGDLLSTHFQLLQGHRSIQQTYTAAETIVLVISDEAGNTPAVTNVLTVLPGEPASLELTADPVWVRAAQTASVCAEVLDAYGNGVPGEPVVFTLQTGSGDLTPVDESTGAEGTACAVFTGPRFPAVDRILAEAGGVASTLDLETALVDPDAAGGTITSYPNPFHPNEAPATIAYVLDIDARVRMRIFTLSGGLVVDRVFATGDDGGRAGLNEVLWDGTNGNGDAVGSGGYIVHVEAEGEGTTLHVMRRKIGVVW